MLAFWKIFSNKKNLIFLLLCFNNSFIDAYGFMDYLGRNPTFMQQSNNFSFFSHIKRLAKMGFLYITARASYRNSKAEKSWSVIVPAFMSIKCGLESLNAQDVGLANYQQLWLRMKAGIKGVSYAALSAYLYKIGHTKKAYMVASFGLLDSIATLPIGDLSLRVRRFMNNGASEKTSLDVASDIQEEQEDYVQKEQKFDQREVPIQIQSSQFSKALDDGQLHGRAFLPCSLIRKMVLAKIDVYKNQAKVAKSEFFKKSWEKVYGKPLGILNLKKIFNYHEMLLHELNDVQEIKDEDDRLSGGKSLLTPISSQISTYRALRTIGVGRYLGNKSLDKTWNRLPDEILVHILFFLDPTISIDCILAYCQALAAWKEAHKSKADSRLPSPLADISWDHWIKLLELNNEKMTFYCRDDIDKKKFIPATITLGNLHASVVISSGDFFNIISNISTINYNMWITHDDIINQRVMKDNNDVYTFRTKNFLTQKVVVPVTMILKESDSYNEFLTIKFFEDEAKNTINLDKELYDSLVGEILKRIDQGKAFETMLRVRLIIHKNDQTLEILSAKVDDIDNSYKQEKKYKS